METDIVDFFFTVIEKYGKLPNEHKGSLQKMLQLYQLKKGENLIDVGSSSGPLFIVYSGILRVYCLDGAGNERNIEFRSSGEITGLYLPYFKQEESKSWFTVQALADCTLVGFSSYFNECLFKDFNSDWDNIVKNIFWERYMQTERRLRSLLIEDATERYENFVKDFPHLHSILPQYHIASYLGITSVSLSRIRAAFSRQMDAL